MSNKRLPLSVEGFDTYATDAELVKSWYTPHGAPVKASLAPALNGLGKSLRFAFKTSVEPGKHYASICRVHFKWDMGGYDAVRFDLKPGGSGHHMTFELNIADGQGKNIHDLWSVNLDFQPEDTATRVVTIPFNTLIPNRKFADAPGSDVFKPADVIEIAMYAGTKDGRHGAGEFVVDNISAVVV